MTMAVAPSSSARSHTTSPMDLVSRFPGHLDDKTNAAASQRREPATDERLGVAPILSLTHALVALELFEVRGAGDRHRRWEGPEAESTRGGGQRGG